MSLYTFSRYGVTTVSQMHCHTVTPTSGEGLKASMLTHIAQVCHSQEASPEQ